MLVVGNKRTRAKQNCGICSVSPNVVQKDALMLRHLNKILHFRFFISAHQIKKKHSRAHTHTHTHTHNLFFFLKFFWSFLPLFFVLKILQKFRVSSSSSSLAADDKRSWKRRNKNTTRPAATTEEETKSGSLARSSQEYQRNIVDSDIQDSERNRRYWKNLQSNFWLPIFFFVVQWPKSHSRPITQGPKKNNPPIHTAGHSFVTSVCVWMRFSPLAENLCSTNHKPLFSRPNRMNPIHILLTLILSTGPNSSFHQSRTVFEGPRMLYPYSHTFDGDNLT
jgi:hypothetical protein